MPKKGVADYESQYKPIGGGIARPDFFRFCASLTLKDVSDKDGWDLEELLTKVKSLQPNPVSADSPIMMSWRNANENLMRLHNKLHPNGTRKSVIIASIIGIIVAAIGGFIAAVAYEKYSEVSGQQLSPPASIEKIQPKDQNSTAPKKTAPINKPINT